MDKTQSNIAKTKKQASKHETIKEQGPTKAQQQNNIQTTNKTKRQKVNTTKTNKRHGNTQATHMPTHTTNMYKTIQSKQPI